MPFIIEVSQDRLICRVSWENPAAGGDQPCKEDLENILNRKKIAAVEPARIDEAYDTLVKEGELKRFLLAQRKAPVPPVDGKVKFLFDPTLEQARAGKLDETGRIDFRERQEFVEVEEDESLAAWIPPVEGQPGVDVYGKPVMPKKPKENRIQPGTNVRLSEDGASCYSTINGHVFVSGLKVSVDRVHKVKGNVDLDTGNIRFPGNVEVSGDVTGSFVVEAKGDIIIGGIVDNAELRAQGSILIKKGVTNSSRIIAGGNVEAEFIQDSYVECGANLTVAKAVVNSDVNTQGDVTVKSRSESHGIIGGSVSSSLNVSVFCLGSPLGAKTKVAAGKNNELFLCKRQLDGQVWQAEENIKRFKYFLSFMGSTQPEKASETEIKKRERIRNAMEVQKSELDTVLKELEEVNARMMRHFSARIKVFGTAYEGVEIGIGETKTFLEQKVEKCLFRFDHKNEIIVNEPLNPYEKE